MNQKHEWVADSGSILRASEIFQLGFLMIYVLLKFSISSLAKSDLKDNRSPGTVACAVSPATGKVSFVDGWHSSKAVNAL
jgi:hypothetical protein